ncbi:hypothetical protein, partial [Deinococcus marmoris]
SSCFTASGSRLLPFQTTIKCPNGKNAVQNTVNIKLSSTEEWGFRLTRWKADGGLTAHVKRL